MYARAVDWDWKIGEMWIGKAELLVVHTQGDRDLWKRDATIPPDWTRDDPDVARAYAAHDAAILYTALFGAIAKLPGLRSLGRAVLFLLWRIAGQFRQPDRPMPWKQLLDDAAYFGVSETTLERAKRRLRMESIRKGGIAGAGRWYVRRAQQQEPPPPVQLPKRGQLPLPLDR